MLLMPARHGNTTVGQRSLPASFKNNRWLPTKGSGVWQRFRQLTLFWRRSRHATLLFKVACLTILLTFKLGESAVPFESVGIIDYNPAAVSKKIDSSLQRLLSFSKANCLSRCRKGIYHWKMLAAACGDFTFAWRTSF